MAQLQMVVRGFRMIHPQGQALEMMSSLPKLLQLL
jgi:hypothetical protein